MKFRPWPYESFTVHTSLTCEEIQTLLDALIEPVTMLGSHKYFEGKQTGNTFILSPEIPYFRNIFQPRMKGTLQKTKEGTDIFIVSRPVLLVIGFLILWTGGLLWNLFGCLVTLLPIGIQAASWEKLLASVLSFLIVAGLLFALYCLPLFFFWWPENRGRKILLEQFSKTETRSNCNE